MGAWVDAARDSIRIVLDELSATRSLALDDEFRALAEEPHWSQLEGMLVDYSFARVLDESHLVARLEGPSVESGMSAALLSTMVREIWKHVKTATTAAVALSSSPEHTVAGWAPKWPESLGMDVTGTGAGSLFLGFRATRDTQPEVGFVDAGFDALHTVMSDIAEAPQYLTESGVTDEIAERFPDDALRDSILSAVYHLSPTGRRGIAAVTFYGGGASTHPRQPATPLTPSIRKALKPLIDQPFSQGSVASVFSGTIRAVDLDARRFVLRGVPEVGAVRCVYPATLDAKVKELLTSGKKAEVRGSYLPTEMPRLVQVEGDIAVKAP